MGWASEWEGGRFLGTYVSEKEKLKSSAESQGGGGEEAENRLKV